MALTRRPLAGIVTREENGTDRSYSCPVSKRQRPPATALATLPGPRSRIWRRRAGGTLMVGTVHVPLLAAKL